MKKTLRYLKIGGLIAVPLVLLLLPSTFFDNGRVVCVSRLLFDMECYACGMTRGIMHLIHFNFAEAWAYNKLSFIVLPVLGIVWLELLLNEFNIHLPYLSMVRTRNKNKESRHKEA